MYKQDPNDSTKQVAKGVNYGHQMFISVFDTAAEITGLKAAKGSMAFCVADSKIYIYTGTTWKTYSAD